MKCSMFIVQTPHQTHKGNGCVLFEIESKILLLLKDFRFNIEYCSTLGSFNTY
jgi:hypothetical protein